VCGGAVLAGTDVRVAVLTPTRARNWAGLVLRVMGRRELNPYQMRTFTGREVRLTWPAEVPVEIDGGGAEPRRQLRFRVRLSALSVCVPHSGAAA
jgi:hypothetical protein